MSRPEVRPGASPPPVFQRPTRQANGSFCALAKPYALLEALAFGHRLHRARTAHLSRMKDLEHILIVGEGDGRFLESLLGVNPRAAITCIDASPAMIRRAQDRLATTYPNLKHALDWRCEDIREAQLEEGSFDAVVTHFLLDCFTTPEARELIRRLGRALRMNGLWFCSDFAVPDNRWRAAVARTGLGLLYVFFRWQTGITARRLPPLPDLMRQNGWHRDACQRFLGGGIESAVWVREPSAPTGSIASRGTARI